MCYDDDHASHQFAFLTASRSERFLKEINFYLAIYAKSETELKRDLAVHLLDIGKRVRCRSRIWSREDLDDIASWKGLRPRMLMIKMNSSDFEDRLDSVVRTEDEPSRVKALCGIHGIGPVLASAVLMFTWPENFGFMDNHTCNALRYLGLNFPKKYTTSRFTVGQLLAYLRIVRTLRERKGVSSMEIAEALYALDSLNLLSHDMWHTHSKGEDGACKRVEAKGLSQAEALLHQKTWDQNHNGEDFTVPTQNRRPRT
jgi:hypothetical protein